MFLFLGWMEIRDFLCGFADFRSNICMATIPKIDWIY